MINPYNGKRMAHYRGTFLCGHEGSVLAYDLKHSQCIFNSSDCKECNRVEWLKNVDKKNEYNLELAKQLNLIPLEGTSKQIAWGNSIRIEVLEKINEISELLKEGKEFDEMHYYFNILERQYNKQKTEDELDFYKIISIETYVKCLDELLKFILEKNKATYFINARSQLIDMKYLISGVIINNSERFNVKNFIV